jgi:hypothetical protein
MKISFRKSFKAGPVRINLSKSGVGASIGVKGVRIGVNSKGQGYTSAGTHGVYVRETFGGKAGAAVPTTGESPGGTARVRSAEQDYAIREDGSAVLPDGSTFDPETRRMKLSRKAILSRINAMVWSVVAWFAILVILTVIWTR